MRGCPARIVQSSRSFSRPISARPEAIDSNSPPLSIFSAPKRRRKISRTAGTKELPPVRKTRSTPVSVRPALSRAWATAVSMAVSSGWIQASNSARWTGFSMWTEPASKRNVASVWLESASFSAETER